MTKTVLVTGDVVQDHFIYTGKRAKPDSSEGVGTFVQHELGGAYALFQVLECAFKDHAGAWETRFGIDLDSIKELPSHLQSYTEWSACPTSPKNPSMIWRMTKPLGYGSTDKLPNTYFATQPVLAETPDPTMVVIDDAALFFGLERSKSLWPFPLVDAKSKATHLAHIVLKMSTPLAQGDLWWQLSTGYRDRLTLIVKAEDLRNEEIRTSKGISWERTAEYLVDDLQTNPAAAQLLNCRHLIVTLRNEGALWVDSSKPNDVKYRLIYDPQAIEGEWGRDLDGEAFGYMSVMTASIALGLRSNQSDLTSPIMHGLNAMRSVHLSGRGPVSGEPRFQFEQIVEKLTGENSTFHSVDVPGLLPRQRSWMMPREYIDASNNPRPLFGMATQIALTGISAVKSIPVAIFGKLTTVDRDEIEALRNLRSLVEEYQGAQSSGKPLSIASFGPPGAGKSFGIKQIAIELLDKDVPLLEFNLSQFACPADLIGAFHQVRDFVLQGKTPVAFWDEFDSKDNEWLQYFLAPMWDGKFQEGQITHSIGKCIFVFAGATRISFEHFARVPDDPEELDNYRKSKTPDFVSRLHGTLNVLGPNRRQIVDAKSGKLDADATDITDIHYPVRRALILRSLFGLEDKVSLDIDTGLLSALLRTKKYTHGNRSLEMIVRHLKSQGGQHIRRSHLPTNEVMAMHVSGEDFDKLLASSHDYKATATVLAPAIHETWCRLTTGKPSTEKPGTVQYSVKYEKLPGDVKSDNLAAAIRIPEILSLVGLTVVKKASANDKTDTQSIALMTQHLEVLAKAEHDGWMKHKRMYGWRPGTPRDNVERIHPALKSYDELEDSDKDKDRNSVNHFKDMVELGGYKIAPFPQV